MLSFKQKNEDFKTKEHCVGKTGNTNGRKYTSYIQTKALETKTRNIKQSINTHRIISQSGLHNVLPISTNMKCISALL